MPAIGNTNPLSIQYLDYSGEVASMTVNGYVLTALNLTDFLEEFGDLQVATDAITLGTRRAQTWGEKSILSNTRPADKDAQIETQMLVRAIDNETEQPFSFRIPTVDYTAFNYASPPAGDQVIISGGGASAATATWIAAYQAVGRSPYNNANGVTVVGMEVVR